MIGDKGIFFFLFILRTHVMDFCYNCLNEAIKANIHDVMSVGVFNTVFLNLSNYLSNLELVIHPNHRYEEFSLYIKCQYKEGRIYRYHIINAFYMCMYVHIIICKQ